MKMPLRSFHFVRLYAHALISFAIMGKRPLAKYVYFLLLITVSGGLLFHPVGVSAQGFDSAGVTHLQEVIINAQKNNIRNTSGTPAQVLSRAELEQVNSLSVADAVRYFSGVQLKDYGGVGGLKTINVRSLGSNHTGVFFDGIELGNAQNGQVDLGKFSLDNIEEIALYDGQKNSIFQPAKGFASGNALYLVSAIPRFQPGKRSNEKLSFRTGSFGLLDPSALWQYKISSRIYSSLSTEWIHSTGEYKFRYTNGVYDTTAVRHNGQLNAFRAEAGLNGTMKDSSAWSARIYSYSSARGLPGAIVANKFDYTQRQWDRNFFFQSSYHKDFKNKYSLLANIKYANDFTRYLDPEYVTTTGFLDNHYAQQELYGSIAARYHVNTFWDIALSEDYQWNKLDANIYHFAFPVRYAFLSAASTELHFPGLNIQGSMLGTFVKDHVSAFTAAAGKTEYSPSVLFSWQPFANNNFHVRGFYKKIFRLPTFNDLYYTFVGNTLLRPEYTWQYDAGVTYTTTGKGLFTFFSTQIDAYYNRVNDKIVAIPGANLFRWTMYNLGKVSITGMEVNAQTGMLIGTVQLHAAISYTYQQALDMTGGDNYRSQIPYTPLNSGSVISGADYKNISLHYSFIYTGSRYGQKANIAVNYLEPWYTHDLSIGWKSICHEKMIKLNVEVNNLLNQYYDVINNFPMPGRSLRASLSCQL
jgi:vitamin B12 transporter